MIQMREQGFDYFMGWNIIDFSQFWLFILYYYFKFISEHPDNAAFMP